MKYKIKYSIDGKLGVDEFNGLSNDEAFKRFKEWIDTNRFSLDNGARLEKVEQEEITSLVAACGTELVKACHAKGISVTSTLG